MGTVSPMGQVYRLILRWQLHIIGWLEIRDMLSRKIALVVVFEKESVLHVML
jgi:hypothetical protein